MSPSILLSTPVISIISDSEVRSTMRARKTSTRSKICARLRGVAATLISASSRVTDGALAMSSTSTTFSSLNRLARMRCPASADASHTSVSRDRPGRSLRPTVSELILMFRRRNSDATRVSTPGRSST